MKLIFISSGIYPNGGAATNRHIAYAKGLKELGNEIIFFLLNKQEWEGELIIENGIKFVCVNQAYSSNNNFPKKVSSLYFSINDAKKKLRNEHHQKKVSKVILLDVDIFILIPLIKCVKRLKINIFHERTEYPFVVAGKSFFEKIKLSIYLNYVLYRFNGIFVINNALKRYFLDKTQSKVPIKVINMIVDNERFICKRQPSGPNTFITYCGTLDGDKDGVDILIKSFAVISNEFSNLKLQLIGSLDNPLTRFKIESLIKTLYLKEKVILTGSVKRNKIPTLLCNSDILALARPNNKQAEGGFPTKLGEYLATGKPVVITNVGEIGNFLIDKKNAFISEPDSVENFATKLREALLNENSVQIGLEGKKLALNEFNYLTQSRSIQEFLLESDKN